MEDQKVDQATHEQPSVAGTTKAISAVLTEINGNILSESQPEAAKPKNAHNWGGDGEEAASDSENQDPEHDNPATVSSAADKTPTKKKKKSKSKKKGKVAMSLSTARF